MKKNYDEKTIVDFCKALEKSKLIIKGSYKNDAVIKNMKECVELTEQELEPYKNNSTIMMLHTEFRDWIETYKRAE